MTDVYNTNRGDHLGMKHQQQDHQYQHQYPQHDSYNYNYNYSSNEPRAHQVVKAATAVTVGGSLLVLSGLILAGTVIALTIATPLLVIFSPVLVPAVITVFLLATGFLTSGGFGVAAATVLAWMYRYVTSEQPRGSNTLDDVTHKLGAKGRDLRDKVGEHAGRTGGHYGTGGVHHTGGGGVGVGAGAYS